MSLQCRNAAKKRVLAAVLDYGTIFFSPAEGRTIESQPKLLFPISSSSVSGSTDDKESSQQVDVAELI